MLPIKAMSKSDNLVEVPSVVRDPKALTCLAPGIEEFLFRMSILLSSQP